MTQAKQTTGFSFQLSDSPPQVSSQQARGEGLGELDLDLQDFGHISPEPPFSIESEPFPEQEFALVAPRTDAAAAGPGFSFELAAAVGDSTKSDAPQHCVGASSPSAQPTPQEQPAASLSDAQPREERKLEAQPRVTEPRIKKIAFPAQHKGKQLKGKAAATPKPIEAARPPELEMQLSPRATAALRTTRKSVKTTTRLSASLTGRAPSVIDERDSEPDLERASQWDLAGDLAEPCDLPDDNEQSYEEGLTPRAMEQGWGVETPNAKEMWRKARVAWQSTSKEALALSGHGLRSAQRIAAQLNSGVRTRLEEAARDRKVLHEEAQARKAELLSQDGDSTPPVTGPSPASRAVLGLAKAGARRVAAPLSALAAASLVYWGSTQLLAQPSTIGLSHATAAPDVPNLGSLPEKEQAAPAQSEQATRQPTQGDSSEEKASNEEPSMQSEVGPLPEGMSWPGKGLIEVVTSEEELIYVDGVFTGRGPLRRIPVTPGEHEIQIKDGGTQRGGTVAVVADKNTRVVFKKGL